MIVDADDALLVDGFKLYGGPGQYDAVDYVRVMNIVVGSSPELMAYWDRDLVCRFCNQAYADWFDRPLAEVIGIRYETLLGLAAAGANRAHIEAVLGGSPQQFEQDLLSPSRGRVSTLTHYMPDVVAGAVVGFSTHVIDVSLLKETERALRAEVEERQRANRIIRASFVALEEAQRLGQIGSWVWKSAPDEVRWSKELYRIMGRNPDGPAPRFAEQGAFYTPESWARLQSRVEIALRTGAPYQLELEYIRTDGVRGWFEARGEAVRSDAGPIIGLRGTVQNMTGPEYDGKVRPD